MWILMLREKRREGAERWSGVYRGLYYQQSGMAIGKARLSEAAGAPAIFMGLISVTW